MLPICGMFFQTSQLKEKDERMKIMNEILNGIKILKLYAWEVAWENRVETVRNREVSFRFWMDSPFISILLVADFVTEIGQPQSHQYDHLALYSLPDCRS